MGEITKKFEVQPRENTKHRIICRECSAETLHSIVTSFQEKGSECFGDGNEITWHCSNQIIQCYGCETVTFRTVSTFSEDWEYDHGNIYHPETIKYYPGRTEQMISIESHLLPPTVEKIYQETILSIENEQYILAGIGIRAIIETICKDLDSKGKNLYEKIVALERRSIVTKEGSETLHKLRILGNDAAHEVKAHNSRQLELSMQIIRHMLEGTYIIPKEYQKSFLKEKNNLSKFV